MPAITPNQQLRLLLAGRRRRAASTSTSRAPASRPSTPRRASWCGTYRCRSRSSSSTGARACPRSSTRTCSFSRRTTTCSRHSMPSTRRPARSSGRTTAATWRSAIRTRSSARRRRARNWWSPAPARSSATTPRPASASGRPSYCRNIKTTPISHDGVVYVSVRVTACRTSGGRSPTPTATARSPRTRSGQPQGQGGRHPRRLLEEVRPRRRQQGRRPRRRGDRHGFPRSVQQGRHPRPRSHGAAGNERLEQVGRRAAIRQSIQAVHGGGTGDVTKTHVVWKVKSKAPDHLVSPLLMDDRLLLVKSGGFASCFGAKKGDLLWEKERIGITATFCRSQSPATARSTSRPERQDRRAVAGPELKVLATNDMGEELHRQPRHQGEFLPEWAWELANRHGLAITMHMVLPVHALSYLRIVLHSRSLPAVSREAHPGPCGPGLQRPPHGGRDRYPVRRGQCLLRHVRRLRAGRLRGHPAPAARRG